MPLLSVRAYARHRAENSLPGRSHPAVLKAIETGRIHRTPEGKIDSELADREWAAATGEQGKPLSTEPQPKPPAPPPARAAAAIIEHSFFDDDPGEPVSAPGREAVGDFNDGGGDGEPYEGMSLAAASAIEKVWKARQAKLDYERDLGTLVVAKDVADRLANVFTLCRTRMLGVPTRTRQALPHLTPADVAAIEGFIREALEDLSNMIAAPNDDEAAPSDDE